MKPLLISSRPRWLYSVGKQDQARRILAKYHSQAGDLNSPLINLEMEEIQEKIEIEGQESEVARLLYFLLSNERMSRTMVGFPTTFQEQSRSIPSIHGHSYW